MASLKSVTTLAILALTIVHVGAQYGNLDDNDPDVAWWKNLFTKAGVSEQAASSYLGSIKSYNLLKGVSTNPGFLRHLDISISRNLITSIGDAARVLEEIKKTLDQAEGRNNRPFGGQPGGNFG